ncbi:serine racemase [Theristicus caerulescens]
MAGPGPGSLRAPGKRPSRRHPPAPTGTHRRSASQGVPGCVVVPWTAPRCEQAAIRTHSPATSWRSAGDGRRHIAPQPRAGGGRGARRCRPGAAGAGEGNAQPGPSPGLCSSQAGCSEREHSRFLSAQAPEVNAVVVPGRGMTAGIAVAIKALRPDVKVFAAEPRNAGGCCQSKVRGTDPDLRPPHAIAGAAKASIGPNARPVTRAAADDTPTRGQHKPLQTTAALLLSRRRATRLVWERMKLPIEPAAGVGVAAVLSEQLRAVPRDVENVCIVLCRGNVDLSSLTWLTDLPGKAE